MSLRTEFHAAYDELSRPIGSLSERVIRSVAEESSRRGHHGRWLVRSRVPLGLVAVFLVLVMVVGVMLGGRVLQDWRNFNNERTMKAFQTELNELRARPINLPNLRTADRCPETGSGNFYGFGDGTGPVYVAGGPRTTTLWGYYYNVVWFTDPSLTGPVLVRARDLRTGQPIIFVGQYSSGAVIATDTSGGTQVLMAELVLDAGHPQHRTVAVPPGFEAPAGFGSWSITQGVAHGWSGCYGFQVDGPGFTETVTGYDPLPRT